MCFELRLPFGYSLRKYCRFHHELVSFFGSPQLVKPVSIFVRHTPPVKAALFTGLSFAVVSLIPVLPFVFMEVNPAVITAAIASIACLFGVGASKAIFTRKSWIKSGVEMMAIGALASVVTYAIGLAIPV